jgi:ketosteroid isomerase-like protein
MKHKFSFCKFFSAMRRRDRPVCLSRLGNCAASGQTHRSAPTLGPGIFTGGKFLSLLLPLLIAPIAPGQTAQKSAQEPQSKQAAKQGRAGQPKSAAAEIRAALDAQVAAWNAGKLEEFMDGYWRSPDLTFFSGGRKLSGWDATIERYRKTYQAEGREMGKLVFSDLDVQLLGPNAALVRGRWELTMSDGKKPGGLYTLVFRRFKQGWKIVHDHTSSNQ